MSLEYEKADRHEIFRHLKKYFAPSEDPQQGCPLCDGTLTESARDSDDTISSDEEQVVAHRIECEDDRCPYIEQDVMVRWDGSEWIINTPPWPDWDPESYDGPDEKIIWFLIALQAMQKNSQAPRCQPRDGNPNWLSQ